MAKSVPTGTRFAYASAYGPSLAIVSITNASPAVASLTDASTVAVNDILEILTCGWGALVGRVFRVSAKATNDVTLEGLDTTDTNIYPTPTTNAAGTAKEVTFSDMGIIARDGTSITPGAARFADGSDLADAFDVEIPDGRAADQLQLVAHYDLSVAWIPVVRGFSASQALRSYRMTHPQGDKTYWSAYVTVPTLPSLQPGQTRRLTIDMRLRADATAYAT